MKSSQIIQIMMKIKDNMRWEDEKIKEWNEERTKVSSPSNFIYSADYW